MIREAEGAGLPKNGWEEEAEKYGATEVPTMTYIIYMYFKEIIL